MTAPRDPNQYPRGLDAEGVRAILDHYENQNESEAVAEAEAVEALERHGVPCASDPERLLRRITADPAIFRGKPIIRGHRLGVEHVLGMLAAGDSPETLLTGYSWLEREDIDACLLYAQRRITGKPLERARSVQQRSRAAAFAPTVRADSGRTYRLFFLCGHPKSGTNWVANVLNLHPKINCQGEFRFEALRRAFDNIQSHWWHVCHHEPARSAAEECFRESVKRIMAAAAASKPDAAWIGDRTPRCVRPFLPGAPNILVLRDPRDILVSWAHQEIREAGPVFQMHDMPHRLAAVRRRFLADPLLFQREPHALFADEPWVRLLARRCRTHMTNDLETLARAEKGELDLSVRTVRYERLHADPEGERAALYEFLDLDPAEAAPLSADTNTRPGLEREDPTRFYRRGRVGDWKSHFTPSARRWFLDEAGDLLVRLEYESSDRW